MSNTKPINAAQDKLYWREWGKVTKSCKKLGFRLPDRHELHIKALGHDKSHVDFTNKDLDKVLAEFRALSKPTSVPDQVRQIRQPATRIIYLIQHDFRASLAILLPIKYGKATLPLTEASRSGCPNFYLADAYLKTILQNRFRTDEISQLNQEVKLTGKGEPKSQLEMYRDTIARCISQARQKIGLTVHELNILAGLKFDCKDCSAGIVPTVPCMMQEHHHDVLAEDAIPSPSYDCPNCGVVNDVRVDESIDTERDDVNHFTVCEKCGAEVSPVQPTNPQPVATVEDDNVPF